MKATEKGSFEELKYKKVKDLNPKEELAPGSALCAGCSGLEGIRLALKVLGEDTLICNAAGCFTLISVYPFTPLNGSWLYTSMSGSVPAAQGARDALDIRMRKHGLNPKEDLQVLVVAGDGASYDMGLSPTSAAIQRHLDFIYFCYDNEAYGNTGFQQSGASPLGSFTMTSPDTREHPAGSERTKKDLFNIWAAHNPPYVATVSPREPIDLSNKFRKARDMKGPRLFICLSPCPTGWGFDPKETHLIAKLAVDTGIFPIKEFLDGQVTHTRKPRKRLPVEKYLERQKRFQHLFKPERREDIIKQIQQNVDAYWEAYDD